MIQTLKNEMREYYTDLGFGEGGNHLRAKLLESKKTVYAQMDAFYDEHPGIHPALLKSHLHTLMAQNFTPKVFLNNPFFYEMGLRHSDSWGMTDLGPGSWMRESVRQKIYKEHPLSQRLEQYFGRLFDLENSGLCAIQRSFDIDHHTLGYTTLFSVGIDGILEQIKDQKAQYHKGTEEFSFLSAAEESCLALILIAEKFATCAEEMLMHTQDTKQRQYLEMVARTAKRIPAKPPQTFYEGLCMLLFTREVIATLENIGISQLGHVDRLLGKLYENDVQAGRITQAQARELIGIWMLHTDIKFDLENSQWPETSTCIQLGGCDRNGEPVYNKVTQMFIEEHHELHLVNPKLNCRFSQQSPREYLKVIGKAILAGHNNFVLINDEVVIPGLVKSGVAPEDARMFVSGGCQETMIEGFGHTEGAAVYVSIARILDLFLRRETGYEAFIGTIDCADSYEAFYQKFLDGLKTFLNLIIDQRDTCQTFNKPMLVCPLFSVTQDGCIENAKDYVYGGAKYNLSTVALVGLGTLADSLYAIKHFVYDQKRLTLQDLQTILEKNWEGFESLRQEAIALPKYGHGHTLVDTFANGILEDLTDYVQTRKNERGGKYIPSLFVYYYFEYFSGCLRATPDGRKNADLISPGCGPSQLQSSKDITEPIKTMSNMDFTKCGGGSAVLDVMLPASNNMNPDIFASFIYACGRYDCPTLQPNVLSREDLIDAKIHPERHKNLIVRISGLSAYFVALTPQVQDEIIARAMYEV